MAFHKRLEYSIEESFSNKRDRAQLVVGVSKPYIYILGDMQMVKILSLNAIVNLVLSAILIPYIGIYGAVIGSIAAEFMGFVLETFLVREYISFVRILLQCVPYAFIGVVMFATVKLVAMITGSGWISLVIQMLVGVIVYSAETLIYMYIFKKKILIDFVTEFVSKLRSRKSLNDSG